jgi:YHS domain-containing protein
MIPNDAGPKAETSSEMKPPPTSPATKPADAKKGDDAPPIEGPKAESAKPASAAVKLTAEELDEIKKLPAAEQAAAISQAVCPVSNHHLGSMEMPVKVTAEGRTFYLCCESCQDKLDANPKGIVAKLDKK